MTILTDSEVRCIRALACGDKTQLAAATLAYNRAAAVHGSDACVELEFMREFLAPVPDLMLRARYRASLKGLAQANSSRPPGHAVSRGGSNSPAPSTRRTVRTLVVPSPDAMLEVIAAAGALIRDRLDDVDVHPCDVSNDEIRSRHLSAEHRRLYIALVGIGAIPPAQ